MATTTSQPRAGGHGLVHHLRFALTNSPSLAELAGLRGFRLCHYLGSSWARQNLDGLDVHWCPLLDNVLRMLASGRLEIFVDVSHVVRWRIQELPQVLDSRPFNTLASASAATRPIWTSCLPLTKKTLRQMHQDGTMRQVEEKWG